MSITGQQPHFGRRNVNKVALLVTAGFLVGVPAPRLFAQPQAPDAAGDSSLVFRAATCDRKCRGKKAGEEQARLHRVGWEAAIRDLGITGTQKKQLLDASTKIEDQIRKAHADLSEADIRRVRKDADAAMRPLLGQRYMEFKEAEFRGRHDHIKKEKGVAPMLDQKPR
jgi:hypothetical protein